MLTSVIKENWPMIAVLTVTFIITRIYYFRINNKEFTLYKEILSLVFIIYLVLLFDLTIGLTTGNDSNFIPFTDIVSNCLTVKSLFNNILSNILLFIPFGYFISSYIKAKNIGSISIISLVVSSCIYLISWKINKTFDVDNIILATIGGIIGFLLFIALGAIKKHLPGLFQSDFLYNIICLAIIVAIILYFLGIISFGWIK